MYYCEIGAGRENRFGMGGVGGLFYYVSGELVHNGDDDEDRILGSAMTAATRSGTKKAEGRRNHANREGRGT